ncbi:hypothetical protein BGZ96_004151 [Linnemannia gamsii]|uniref:F-box domain-containing protein n=1 Tax=Linnemannia gamsii TaxID=64522 RepID=A0ABQ7K6Q2_9FUNG|nr:hypothetical protein BGZ96_004151 [Linnemannia gamsii]
MSVFEIPELSHLIAPYLDPHDLTRCVRVNKTWNASYIPFLWKTVPPFSKEDVDDIPDLQFATIAGVALRPYKCWDAFRSIVIEDYQYSQQQARGGAEGEGGGGTGVLPTLSRHCQWIRNLSVSQVNMRKLPKELSQFKFKTRSLSTDKNTSIDNKNSDDDEDDDDNDGSTNNSSIENPPGMFSMDPFYGFGLGNLAASESATAGRGVDRDFMSLLTASLYEDTFGRSPSPRRPTNPSKTKSTASTSCPTNVAAPEPSGKELILHLLKRTLNLQSLELISWDDDDIAEDRAFWKSIATDVVPRLQELSISIPVELRLSQPSPHTVPLMLAYCSSKMRSLKLELSADPGSMELSFPVRARRGKAKSAEVSEPKMDETPLTGMKNLSVVHKFEAVYPPSLPRFLARCVNLEDLEVTEISPTWYEVLRGCEHLRRLTVHGVNTKSVRFIADALKTSLLHLDEIEIHKEFNPLKEGVVTDMISSCRAGWKTVDITALDTAAAEALVKHCPTLERLELKRSANLSSLQMQQILSSSPRLTTFVSMHDNSRDLERDWCGSAIAKFAVQDFIDLDSTTTGTTTLKPWACESTLKVFAAKVTGIPRPDVNKTFHGHSRRGGLQETYPGQSQELQRQVYERLARFTHLEELELGHDDRNWDDDESYVEAADGGVVFDDQDYQYECMDLTLENGLGLLEGLKELKSISIMRMATRVGLEEVKWMVANWPKFEYISGLDVHDMEEKAAEWLDKNYPNIAVVPYANDG